MMSKEPTAPSRTDDLPAGDSPPPPRWHLPLAFTAWSLWFLFLLCMVWFRFNP